MRYLLALALACAPCALADSIQTVASDLRADSPVPFRYGVADDLAANLLAAQALAPYASASSLDLSIAAVVRAIGIDGTAYVGWAATDPITWLQSDIAIDPDATLGFSPDALRFGSAVVASPESATWVMIIISLVLIGALAGWKWLRARPAPPLPPPPPPPVIMTAFGPVSEPARKRAALNMKEDAELREQMEAKIQAGLDVEATMRAAAIAETRRRYPEAYGD